MNWYDILKSNNRWDKFSTKLFNIAESEGKLKIVTGFLGAVKSRNVDWNIWVNHIGPSKTLSYLTMYRAYLTNPRLKFNLLPEFDDYEYNFASFVFTAAYKAPTIANRAVLETEVKGIISRKDLNNIYVVVKTIIEEKDGYTKSKSKYSFAYYSNGFYFTTDYPSLNPKYFKEIFNKFIKGKTYILCINDVHKMHPISDSKLKVKLIRGGFI